MDYQASTSSGKEISNIRYRVSVCATLCYCIALLLFVPISNVFADDPTPNPLTENVTISATVLAGTTNSPIPPNSSSQNPGPVNMTDTMDVAIFRGYSYPGSQVSILKNGVLMATIPTNPDGTFEIRIRNLNPGTYSFGLQAKDTNGLISKLLIFSIYVSSSVATTVDGIFIPPTITSDKIEVKKGDPIIFFGKSVPNTEVRLSLSKTYEVIKRANAGADGSWFYEVDTGEFDFGDYVAKAKSLNATNTSIYSDLLSFRVGDENRDRPKMSNLSGYRKRCDLNDDGRVNLLDFSIMAFWYKRLTFPPKVDLNSDNNINLTDLSILAYCWTG